MDQKSLPPNRRLFLAGATAAIIAAHGEIAPASRATRPGSDSPLLLSLELLTASPLAKMKEFYHRSLGLRVLDEGDDRLTVGAGATTLTFVKAAPGDGKPFYHFAFNIPENKVLAARDWQKERTPLLPIPERLRDPKYPDDVVNYSHWNAHSLFFFDPAGNVVEHIARHNLKNAARGPFRSEDILYASEIAFVVDDVAATADKMKEAAGVSQYRGASDQFAALGDERGLLLVMKRGRVLSFDAPDKKEADVFRTTARVRGVKAAKHRLSGFPYEVVVET